ncbi:MAG TPA: hypothetical protein ENJ09_14215 [Planctomycetes bacterium]|nr:hypothetical protein [Planctomycetota bacterium]
MTRKRLTLEQGALLVLGLSTMAWMGVPRYGRYRAPDGAIAGVVLDAEGSRVDAAEVALFDDTRRILVERVRTDDHGRFAFSDAPERFDVFAWDEGASMRTGTWVLARDRAQGTTLELRLGRGTPRTVHVTDEAGAPVAGAEVRVIDARGEPQVIQRAMTDASGTAEVLLPPRSHVAVLPRTEDALAPRWLLDLPEPEALPEEVALAAARTIEGRVADEAGEPLAATLVSAWSRDGERWLGWTLSSADGTFRLATDGTPAVLRIADPTRAHLARAVVLPERLAAQLGTVVLPSGSRVAVQVGTGAGPIPARVWVRGRDEDSWSFGGRTDSRGRIELTAAERFSAVALPLEASSDASGALIEAHDLVPNGRTLQLVGKGSE